MYSRKQILDVLTTPLPVDGHTSHTNQTTKQRSKLVHQWPSLPFVWRPLQSIKVAAIGKKTGSEGFRTADLEHLLQVHWYLCSGRLILLYSDHLQGRQTIENQLVHTGTSSYQCTHIITSSISVLVHYFSQFYFRRSRSVRENHENLQPA